MKRVVISILEILLYVAVAVFALTPLLWGLKISLAPAQDLKIIPSSLTLEHYRKLLQKKEVIIYFFNSMKIALGALAIVFPVSLTAAYGLARYKFKGRVFLGVSFLILPMLPATAILVPLVSYFNRLGLYNTLLSVTIVHSIFNMPLAIWMLRNFIINTPVTIEEAAMIDGLNPLQTLFRITLPMIAPGIVSVLVYVFINCWNNYTYSYALTTSQSYRVLSQGVLSFLGSWGTYWGGLTAIGIITLIPPILLFLIFQKWFVAGMFGESLK